WQKIIGRTYGQKVMDSIRESLNPHRTLERYKTIGSSNPTLTKQAINKNTSQLIDMKRELSTRETRLSRSLRILHQQVHR
ncbi:MAG TPA: hypothetical protein VE177_05930, partial [Candidatus Binatus sp.]|nr:hypothetical protein [Candidatus Binatus sp.]